MLVRAGNEGEWLPLEPVHGLPEGGLRSLFGRDPSSLLELDEPLPVAAYGPWPHGANTGIDAVCLTRTGDIELVVASFDEAPRDTLWRMLDVAGTLRGTTLDAFAAHCTELGSERSVTRWLHDRVGGDVYALERRLKHVLETGAFGFMLVTSRGAGELAQPLTWLQGTGGRVRVFEVGLLHAGGVQAVEGSQVPLAGAPQREQDERPELRAVPDVPVFSAAQAVAEPVVVPTSATRQEVEQPQPAPERVEAPPATEPEPVAQVEAEREPEPEQVPVAQVEPVREPEAEPVAHAEPEPEPVAQAEPEPVAQAEPEPEPEVELLPSDVAAFTAALEALDHRATNNLRWLHDALLKLVDEAEYTTDGELEHVAGWVHGTDRVPLFGLDSQGLLQLVLRTLPTDEQAEFADEVAGLLPEADGAALLAAGYAEVDVVGHLDDQTLLEYLVDNLIEALPGGREAFGTGPEPIQPAPPAEEPTQPEAATADEADAVEPEADAEDVGDDFFAGVSAGHDPADVNSAMAAHGMAPELQEETDEAEPAAAEAEPASEPAAELPKPAYEPEKAEQPGKRSRWRRRKAA